MGVFGEVFYVRQTWDTATWMKRQ